MKKIILSMSALAFVGVLLAGGTYAAWSASATVEGNTISTGQLSLDLHGKTSGEIDKPINVSGLFPGDWTGWARLEIYNQSSIPVKLYMYAENLSGDACEVTNLEVRTGYAGGDEKVRLVYMGALEDIEGVGKRVEVTGYPPFEYMGANITQVIHQRAQLDDGAGDQYQNTSCMWDEVFVIEKYEPAI